jgi:hypothetical protein
VGELTPPHPFRVIAKATATRANTAITTGKTARRCVYERVAFSTTLDFIRKLLRGRLKKLAAEYTESNYHLNHYHISMGDPART